MNQVKVVLKHVWAHFPAYVAVALVVVNALIDAGDVVIPPHVLDVVNAVLAASGLGILHARQIRN